ncbi:putative phage lysis protein, endopeptidase [Candidatus Regiella insecticola]|uniref:Putative phage lysis protein, endopeptidase n=2 Tax=Candidatus Regiella insecticola TaxID=138073 RepID=A0A6L2ZMU8_9ENTR|nr:putative phage lysis protein, endopeptidase [Candidatus Regiella insecticola]
MFNRGCFILMSLILLMSLAAGYYHFELAKKENIIKRITDERNNALLIMEGIKKQHQQLTALDNQHTQELTHAKTQLAALERDVNDKQRRVQLNATCPLSPATASTGLDDGTRARLNDTAIKHYFHLRERIDTATQQIAGLQDYIRQVCLQAEG